jgi:hypothetical protein
MEDDVGVLNTRDEGQSRTEVSDIEESPPDEDVEGELTSTATDNRQVRPKIDSKPADNEVDPTNTNNGVILDEQVKMQSMSPVRREGQQVVPEDQSATDDQREGSQSKSASNEIAGQTPDTAVQPLNLLGDFTAAAVSSESSESAVSKFVDTRTTGSELESGVTTFNSVLEEMYKNHHESDDEDLNSDYSGATQDESDSYDSDDHHNQSMRAQLLSNHPNIKRMEHLSSRNLDLHDQQRLRRWV